MIKDTNQTITPPKGDGDRTQHNANCTWIIVAPPKYTVNLYWNAFDIEETDDCHFDHVTVTDGLGSNHTRRYCGTTIPPVMTSVGNVMTINFVSDSTVSSDGFSLTYSFNNPGQGKGTGSGSRHDQEIYKTPSLNYISVCGGTFLAAGGFIQSPNYPEPYPPFKDCTWIIQAPSGHQIQLKPKSFAMEGHDNCAFDFLEVR